MKNNVLVGILLALSLIPGAIAFSLIAGVSPSIGLMGTGMIMIVISVIGNRTLMISAPSSGVSLIVAPFVADSGLEGLIVATFVMGITQIIFGFSRIHRLINTVPQGVVIGFMNALGILLLTSQLEHIFPSTLTTYSIVFISFLLIWLFPKATKRIPAPLVTIVVMSLVTWVFQLDSKLVKDITDVHLDIDYLTIFNHIADEQLWLSAMIYGIAMAIVATIQNALTQQVIDQLTKSKSDMNKESMGQGITNIIVSFLGGYGGSALVGQSRFNITMGGTSRVSTLVTGSFLLISIYLFGALLTQIPMAVLATVLITIAVSTFDRRTIAFIRRAPLPNGSTVVLTMCIILVTNNLAVGVIVVTLCYHLIMYITNREGT